MPSANVTKGCQVITCRCASGLCGNFPVQMPFLPHGHTHLCASYFRLGPRPRARGRTTRWRCPLESIIPQIKSQCFFYNRFFLKNQCYHNVYFQFIKSSKATAFAYLRWILNFDSKKTIIINLGFAHTVLSLPTIDNINNSNRAVPRRLYYIVWLFSSFCKHCSRRVNKMRLREQLLIS